MEHPVWYSVIRFDVDTDSLTIKDVTDGDEGTYTCIMNTTLDQDSASAMLTVVGTSMHSRVFALSMMPEVKDCESRNLTMWTLDTCVFKESEIVVKQHNLKFQQ